MTHLDVLNNKIYSLETLTQRRNMWRVLGQRVVFTNGCFDLLHRGHLQYLAEARELGHVLIVGINSDQSVKALKGPNRPLLNEVDRAFQLASLHAVDALVVFDEETPLNLLKALQPDVLVKGGDYAPDQVVGKEVVEAAGGRVQIIPFLAGYSTTALIDRIQNGEG